MSASDDTSGSKLSPDQDATHITIDWSKLGGNDPQDLFVTFFDRAPGSTREGVFVAVDLDAVDALIDTLTEDMPIELSHEEIGDLREQVLNDPVHWMYVEGEAPEGAAIAYYEVDSGEHRIIGPA